MSHEINHDALYEALKTMVQETQRFSERENLLVPGRNGTASWFRERRTVLFGLGRRMGHTTLGVRLALESKGPVLLLAHNTSLALHLKDKVREAATYFGIPGDTTRTIIRTIDGFLMNPSADRRFFDLIIVDCASLVSDSKRKRLWGLASVVGDPLFVLLQ